MEKFSKSKSLREVQKTRTQSIPGYGSFKIIPTIDGKKESLYPTMCISALEGRGLKKKVKKGLVFPV